MAETGTEAGKRPEHSGSPGGWASPMKRRMFTGVTVVVLLWPMIFPLPGFADQDLTGVRPLQQLPRSQIQSVVPSGVMLLHDPSDIEAFLASLDGQPPAWNVIYGPDGAGHGDLLFALNRERDRAREGRAALQQPVAFLWTGELSTYDPRPAGFRVAMGPEVIQTRWGLVRFKPAGLPGELIAVPPPSSRQALRDQVERGERIEVHIVMTGRLLSDESIIYDFAHEEPGRGMVMPVVRIERLDYVLAD